MSSSLDALRVCAQRGVSTGLSLRRSPPAGESPVTHTLSVDDYVDSLMATRPQLTPEQRERLRRLLPVPPSKSSEPRERAA